MDFFKYHALGNDYIVIDPSKTEIDLSAHNIRLICHRNFGVGSDGILYGPIFDSDKIALKILNPDGSEAEKSGNGLRIFTKYLVDANYVDQKVFNLNTLGGLVTVEILDDEASQIKVDMGTVTFQSDRIPVAGAPREVVNETLSVAEERFTISCVSIGNPHCVIPLDEISKELTLRIGPLVETHSLFPNKINMQLLKVIDRQNIRIEIWERGAGYTLASGSSSCAAASVAYKLGYTDNQMKVLMPGGQLDIDIQESGHVFMTGSVSGVASGEFRPDFWQKLRADR